MKKTTSKLLKVAEYGASGVIWSYDYSQFMKYREAAVKRVNALDKDSTKKEKAKAYAKLCGTCFAEVASYCIASTMFTNALVTGAELLNSVAKKK